MMLRPANPTRRREENPGRLQLRQLNKPRLDYDQNVYDKFVLTKLLPLILWHIPVNLSSPCQCDQKNKLYNTQPAGRNVNFYVALTHMI